MKKLLLIAALLFCASTNAKTIMVFGQSNGVGVVRSGALKADNVINCSFPGMSISKLQLNFNRNSLFGICMQRALSIGKPVDALVFWQGEADTRSMEMAEEWSYKASRVIRDIQSYTGNIPVVLVALHDEPPQNGKVIPEAWEYIRQQQMGFLGVKIIDSTNYEFKPDNVHLTDSGYYSIASAINEILK